MSKIFYDIDSKGNLIKVVLRKFTHTFLKLDILTTLIQYYLHQ